MARHHKQHDIRPRLKNRCPAVAPPTLFPLLALGCLGFGPWLRADPLALHDRGDLRADFSIDFTEAGPPTGTVVPNDFAFTPGDAGPSVTVRNEGPGAMTLFTGDGGYFTTGTLLFQPGPGSLAIFTGRAVQGFGVTMETNFLERATYTLEALTASSEIIATATGESSGAGGEPVFLGVLDPAARIEMVRLYCGPSGPNSFVLSHPVFQIAAAPSDHPSTLPVMAGFGFKVDGVATYLHEGLNSATPATETATEDNPNVLDLQDETRFPSLRGGDVLRFQAAFAGGGNPLMGLLSRTEEIKAGHHFVRVPGALNAGSNYPTSPASNGPFPTPTDIGSDFVIGARSYVEVPSGTRYLMFSLAQPSPGFSGAVQVDWIPRTLFENWLLTYGLTGGLAGATADPDGDGLNNIEEFAYGKDPTSSDAGTPANFAFAPNGRLAGTGLDERLVLSFGGLATGPVRYRPAFSSDLADWQIGSPLTISAILFNDGATRAVFQTADPTGGARRFGRILVEPLPRP